MIRPLDCDKQSAKEKSEYLALESTIDNALASTYAPGNCVFISLAGSVSQRVINRIAEDYRGAGWNVEIGDDQRDGMSLRFSSQGGRL